MLLTRWGEFCCVGQCRERCQWLMSFGLSGRSIEREVEIGNGMVWFGVLTH